MLLYLWEKTSIHHTADFFAYLFTMGTGGPQKVTIQTQFSNAVVFLKKK